ncbi:hypothetical protein DFS34DRAFT_697575 [Phlyctochytrium arcticum]|nr:hypothetical protein DFS34DRAFT_697575 [Phlyctochytrium arcticum]
MVPVLELCMLTIIEEGRRGTIIGIRIGAMTLHPLTYIRDHLVPLDTSIEPLPLHILMTDGSLGRSLWVRLRAAHIAEDIVTIFSSVMDAQALNATYPGISDAYTAITKKNINLTPACSFPLPSISP